MNRSSEAIRRQQPSSSEHRDEVSLTIFPCLGHVKCRATGVLRACAHSRCPGAVYINPPPTLSCPSLRHTHIPSQSTFTLSYLSLLIIPSIPLPHTCSGITASSMDSTKPPRPAKPSMRERLAHNMQRQAAQRAQSSSVARNSSASVGPTNFPVDRKGKAPVTNTNDRDDRGAPSPREQSGKTKDSTLSFISAEG